MSLHPSSSAPLAGRNRKRKVAPYPPWRCCLPIKRRVLHAAIAPEHWGEMEYFDHAAMAKDLPLPATALAMPHDRRDEADAFLDNFVFGPHPEASALPDDVLLSVEQGLVDALELQFGALMVGAVSPKRADEVDVLLRRASAPSPSPSPRSDGGSADDDRRAEDLAEFFKHLLEELED